MSGYQGKRTIEDIRKYQQDYYKKNTYKVYCNYCDKYINNRNFLLHRFTNKHLRLMKNTEIKPKVRKVRCDKGIPKKPKPPVKEFKPNETITLIL
jgi:hypothetical protein